MTIETGPKDQLQFRGVDLYRPAIDLLRLGKIGWRWEMIPLHQITPENIAIDGDHAERLVDSIISDTQVSEVALRARLVKIADIEQVTNDVIDGFHRTIGMRVRAANDPNLLDFPFRACVRYGVSNQKLAEYRILATTVKSVQISRIAIWIKDFYEETNWFKRGISVYQAFSLGASDSQSSRSLRLLPSEVTKLREMVEDRSAKWGRPPDYIADILRVTENADPHLIRRIRTGGTDADAIHMATLKEIIDIYPGKQNYGAQHAILRYAVTHELTAQHVRKFVLMVDHLLRPGMNPDEAYFAIKNIEFFQTSTDSPSSTPTEFLKPTATPVKNSDVTLRPRRHTTSMDQAAQINESPQAHQYVQELQDAVKKLRAELETLKLNLPWWITFQELTDQERSAVEHHFGRVLSGDETAKEMRITSNEVLMLINSARRKYRNAI